MIQTPGNSEPLCCKIKFTPVLLCEWKTLLATFVVIAPAAEPHGSDVTLCHSALTVPVTGLVAGNNHMKEENYAAAVDCYTQAIELDPNNAVYYCNR